MLSPPVRTRQSKDPNYILGLTKGPFVRCHAPGCPSVFHVSELIVRDGARFLNPCCRALYEADAATTLFGWQAIRDAATPQDVLRWNRLVQNAVAQAPIALIDLTHKSGAIKRLLPPTTAAGAAFRVLWALEGATVILWVRRLREQRITDHQAKRRAH